MTGRYEIQMSLIVAQESLYQMKYKFEQLRNFYTDFTTIFILRVNIRVFPASKEYGTHMAPDG